MPLDPNSYFKCLEKFSAEKRQLGAIIVQDNWLAVQPQQSSLKEQGWKIHISSGVACSLDVLSTVLPILNNFPCSFKVARNPSTLSRLNSGYSGKSQIGKFITVYPNSDEIAVSLANALHNATLEYFGPEVPSDLPFDTGSNVYYRYGAFTKNTIQMPSGDIVPAIKSLAGEMIPDVRRASYTCVDGFDCPFPNHKYQLEISTSMLIANRYLVISQASRTARGAVYLAHDIEKNIPCVVKVAKLHHLAEAKWLTPASMLRKEHKTLTKLSHLKIFPNPLCLKESDGYLILAMSYLSGVTLSEHILSHFTRNGPLVTDTLISISIDISAAMALLHAQGFVYRDLKSSNIIIDSHNKISFVDAEHIHSLEDLRSGVDDALLGGTRGYVHTEHRHSPSMSLRHDAYSLGSILYYICTGAEPSRAPDGDNLLSRSVNNLNPNCPQQLVDAIIWCINVNDYPNTDCAGIAESLRNCIWFSPGLPPPRVKKISHDNYLADSLKTAVDLVNELNSILIWEDDICGKWHTSHDLSAAPYARDLHVGVAGIIVALSEAIESLELNNKLSVSSKKSVLAACNWLIKTHSPDKVFLPGLYAGEMGVAYALAKAGTAIENSSLLNFSESIAQSTVDLPHLSPDLFNGTAGRLRGHLKIYELTGKQTQLSAAERCADNLVEHGSAYSNFDGWMIPEGYGGLSGNVYLGYAHGIAGIADCLLDMFRCTGNEKYLFTAQNACNFLLEQMELWSGPVQGAFWNSVYGKPGAAPPYWCHGAGGISIFLIHMWQLSPTDRLREVLSLSLRSVIEGSRWTSPTYCHGLSGSIDCVLEAYFTFKDKYLLEAAIELFNVLLAYKAHTNGGSTFFTENPETVTPDLMVGYSGVIRPLLRLHKALK